MAQFRKMAEEEIEAAKPQRKGADDERKQIAEAYRSHLSQYTVGDWVEVNLDEGDKRDSVKARIKRIAEDMGYKLDFKRTRGDRLRFQINQL